MRCDRSLFGGIGEEFILEDPTLVIGLRSERAGGVIDEFEIALVLRHAGCHLRLDVVEHLVRSGDDDMHRAVAYSDRRARLASAGGPVPCPKKGLGGAGSDGFAFVDDGFEQLDGRFVRRSADVAGADIVVVGEDAGYLAIQIDTFDPVLLRLSRALERAQLFRCQPRLLLAGQLWRWRRWSGLFAEIGVTLLP